MDISLSHSVVSLLGSVDVLGDRVKKIASTTREAQPAEASVLGQDFAEAKRETLAAVDRLEERAGDILKSRQADEQLAERVLTWGGIFAMALPAIGLVLNLLHVSDTWVTAALSGATLTGVLSFLFKPGNRLLALARERQELLILPHAFRARIAAADGFPALQKAAADLAAALRGEPVQV
jgi:hypothetical protein